MADISKIILPDNTEYNVSDSTARSRLESISGLAHFAIDKANEANNKASAAVPNNDYITTAEINQIWEAN